MRSIINAKLVGSKESQPAEKPFEIWDSRLSGFVLRVQPSGARSYYAQIGRGRRITLGRVGELKPDEARDKCEKVLGNVAHGRPPLHGIDGAGSETLGDFIAATYTPWVKTHRPRTAQQTLDRLKLHFFEWYGRPLTAITLADVENWRTARINDGIEPSTVRRDLDSLSAVLTRALKLKRATENVVRQVERPKLDRSPKVRYLSKEEEAGLRAALGQRDEEMRAARISANKWRTDRRQDPLPTLPHFGDHLTAAVLVSMNTGLRRGELLALRWAAIDFRTRQLTIEGPTARNQQMRRVPLNNEAIDALKHWKEQAPEGERVFAIDTGFKSAWAPVLARAKITAFRWHDLRHHFASRLAQAGVPLNTIRELLGHGSLTMTLRYAHLAPDQRADAVAKLMDRSA